MRALLAPLSAALTASRSAIIAQAAAETALTPDELLPEALRMERTLLLFSSYSSPILHDPRPAEPSASIGPAHDLHRLLIPLPGRALVFGASNFPLAYGVCGGDTASALAAGLPVTVKEHPAHPLTGRLLASLVHQTLAHLALAADTFRYIPDDGSHSSALARDLINSSDTAAVGFTGSLAVGAALDSLARARPLGPIPVFAEMGSTNPILIFPHALAARAPAIAAELAASILARHGQQCTCPGLIALPASADPAAAHSFTTALTSALAQGPARRLLAPSVHRGLTSALAAVRTAAGSHLHTLTSAPLPAPADDPAAPVSPMLFAIDTAAALAAPAVLSTELFGPAAILLTRADFAVLVPALIPSLTLSVYFDPADLPALTAQLPALASRAGRIIFNGVPTGVRVSPAMVHSGPFPACNRPDTTAVGPHAITRWLRPICLQNMPDAILHTFADVSVAVAASGLQSR